MMQYLAKKQGHLNVLSWSEKANLVEISVRFVSVIYCRRMKVCCVMGVVVWVEGERTR